MTKLSFRVLYQWSPLHTYKLKKKKKKKERQRVWMVESSFEDERSHGTLNLDTSGSIHDWCFLTWNTTSQNKVIRSSPTEAHSFIHPHLLTHTHVDAHPLSFSLSNTLTCRDSDVGLWAYMGHDTLTCDRKQSASVDVCTLEFSLGGQRCVCACARVCVSACVSCKQSGGHWWCRLTGGINTQ